MKTVTFSWEMHSFILVGICFINLNVTAARTSSRTCATCSQSIGPGGDLARQWLGRFGCLSPELTSPPDERVTARSLAVGLAARMRLAAPCALRHALRCVGHAAVTAATWTSRMSGAGGVATFLSPSLHSTRRGQAEPA